MTSLRTLLSLEIQVSGSWFLWQSDTIVVQELPPSSVLADFTVVSFPGLTNVLL